MRATTWFKNEWNDSYTGHTFKALTACAALFAIVIAFAITMAVHEQHKVDAWAADCEAHGNHVVRLHKDFICVTPDGRIVGL